MSKAISGAVISGIDHEIIERHFSDQATSACTLVVHTVTGVPFEVQLSARTATEPTSASQGDYHIPHSRPGKAARGNTTYAGLVHFDPVQNSLTVHDPNTGYLVLQSTPVDTITEVA
jgi:hypothetical protein